MKSKGVKIQTYFKITFMQEERCHMIQNTQSITIINERDTKHYSSSILGQKRLSSFESVPHLPPNICVEVFFCLYRSTSSNTEDDGDVDDDV